MGSIICVKCKVPAEYYLGRDPGNSCSVHETNCYCRNKSNCFHKFEFVNYITQYKNHHKKDNN